MYIGFYTIHNPPVQFLYVVVGLTEIYSNGFVFLKL